MKDFLEKLNPANAKALSENEIAEAQTLTIEQIGQLAEKYPNKRYANNYLRLRNKRLPNEQQSFPLSSWQNLYSLVKGAGQSQFCFHSFLNTHLQMAVDISANVSQVPADTTTAELKEIGSDAPNANIGTVGAEATGKATTTDSSEAPTPTPEPNVDNQDEDLNEKSSTDEVDYLGLAIEQGLAEQKGVWYHFGDQKVMGKDNALQHIMDDTELKKEILNSK